MLANITTESYPVEFYPAKSSLKRNTCVLKKFQFLLEKAVVQDSMKTLKIIIKIYYK